MTSNSSMQILRVVTQKDLNRDSSSTSMCWSRIIRAECLDGWLLRVHNFNSVIRIWRCRRGWSSFAENIHPAEMKAAPIKLVPLLCDVYIEALDFHSLWVVSIHCKHWWQQKLMTRFLAGASSTSKEAWEPAVQTIITMFEPMTRFMHCQELMTSWINAKN